MIEKKRSRPSLFVAALVSTGLTLAFVSHGLSQTAGRNPHDASALSEHARAGTVYEVVTPVARETKKEAHLAPRLDDLAGKTVCALANHVFQYKVTFPIIAEDLKKSYPGLKFIPFGDFPDTHDETDSGKKAMANLAGLLKERGCQAVISGNGG